MSGENQVVEEVKRTASKVSVSEMILHKQVEMNVPQMMELANHFYKSRFFPSHIDSPEKALVVMMVGRDLGISFTGALQSVSVIKGRPCIEAKMLLALCLRTNQVETYGIKTPPDDFKFEPSDKFTCMIKRKGMEAYTATWTLEKAVKLGITTDRDGNTKDNWRNQPGNMLRWRAIAEACRFTFPDATSGCYVAEEIADDVVLDVQGQVVEVIENKKGETQGAAETRKSQDHVGIDKKKSDDIPDEMLGEWLIPGGRYKGVRMIEVVADKTPTGKLKGVEYLDDMATRASDPDARIIISRFLAILRRDGAIPETGYDVKDIPNEEEEKPKKKNGTNSSSKA